MSFASSGIPLATRWPSRRRPRRPALAGACLAFLWVVVGCEGTPGTGPPRDAGVDSGPDASSGDAGGLGVDAGDRLDASAPDRDAGPTTGARETFLFDPDRAQTLTTRDGAGVTLEADSLVTEAGDPPTGQVVATVQNLIIAGSGPEDMPGSFTGRTIGGEEVVLLSYGAIDVAFVDDTGARLNLSPGRTAQIVVPSFTAGPATIPMWHLAEGSRVWTEEGTGYRVGDRYEATVSHFSSWNCDDSCTGSCVQGFARPGTRVVARLLLNSCPTSGGMPLSGAVTTADARGVFLLSPLGRASYYHLVLTDPDGLVSEQVVRTPLDTGDACAEPAPRDGTVTAVFDWHFAGQPATWEECLRYAVQPQVSILGSGWSIGGECALVNGDGTPRPGPDIRLGYGTHAIRFDLTDVASGSEVVVRTGPRLDIRLEPSDVVVLVRVDYGPL